MRKKPELMTASNVRKLFSKFLILTLAFLMEEPEFQGNNERLVEMYDKLAEWLVAVQDHTISIQRVKTIVEEHTGEKVYF